MNPPPGADSARRLMRAIRALAPGASLDRRGNPTRYEREVGVRLPRWRDRLAAYEKDGGYYVHFSDYPRLGLYLNNLYNTPTGFYAYPLTFERMTDFALERAHALILRVRPTARLLDLGTYGEDDLARDMARLNPTNDPEVQRAMVRWQWEARVWTPGARIWNVTRQMAGGNVSRWTVLLSKTLGYDGVIDGARDTSPVVIDGVELEDERPRVAIIHPNEPYQAVFFNTSAVELMDVVDKSPDEDIDVSGRAFALGLDLRGKDFAGRAFGHSAVFTGSDLTGAIFADARLVDAVFANATLVGADMRRADLGFARLAGADLRDARLSAARLMGADLRRADLRGADLSAADLRGARLRGARLDGVRYDAATRWPDGFAPP